MEEEGWLGLGAAAALARGYAEDGRGFLETLASLLETVLPGQVEVVRKGGLLSRHKPITRLTLQLTDDRYILEAQGSGPLTAQRALVKRGILLRTEDIPVAEWIEEVGAALDAHARASGEAAAAMRRFCST